jgi:hypothetical protein
MSFKLFYESKEPYKLQRDNITVEAVPEGYEGVFRRKYPWRKDDPLYLLTIKKESGTDRYIARYIAIRSITYVKGYDVYTLEGMDRCGAFTERDIPAYREEGRRVVKAIDDFEQRRHLPDKTRDTFGGLLDVI